MEKQKLLIIDAGDAETGRMVKTLSGEYEIFTAGAQDCAMQILREVCPQLVMLDLGLSADADDADGGLKLLGRLLQHDPLIKVVVITGDGSRDSAIGAISLGAHDFLVKPVNMDELRIILRRASYVHSLEFEHRNLQKNSDEQGFGEVLGASSKMQEIFSTVRKVAATDVPVLVTGESGTGKELVARSIHANSIRCQKPFIPINCGAIPENLLESELFGHEKGAFTGAHIQRSGRIEMAQGGTLFLDEIAELPIQLQVKVLRFLQDHKIERIGGRGTISADIRIIAATNKCVKKMIAEEKFREDLYYRLAVVTIELPALRERGDDIVLLAKSFLRKYLPDGEKQKTLGLDAVHSITTYGWPGNVRELENRIRRAITFSDGPFIRPSELGFGSAEEPQQLDLKKAKEDLEVRFVKMAINKHNGNISKASEELGLSRPTVHQIIKKHKMTESARKG